ncbi:MAG TPA: glycoside hydrolase family 3 protein [Methanospirillum sp.]|nr:glycoside hydrolase family 3 protein [Methanospirillum sp.]
MKRVCILLLCLTLCSGAGGGIVLSDTTGVDPALTLSEMTPRERVGQVFMPAISMPGSNGTTAMTGELKAMLDTIHPGGVILFARDIVSPGQVLNLTGSLQDHALMSRNGEMVPLLIGIDQEGGYIGRLPFGPRMPGNMALGATGSPEKTREVAVTIGEGLAALGITMNFAPVLDVETNQNNPVIGIRSFGENPEAVAELGNAYIDGMHDSGILSTGKHFPGHGDVDVDSHFGLPREDHTRERMNQVELVPFRAAIAHGIDAIMTAHIIFPVYDNSSTLLADGSVMPTPATLSRPILTDLLRDELGFEGLIITDAMTMKAITDRFTPGEAAVQAIRAGADIVLFPDDLDEAYEAVLDAYERDPQIQARVNESVLRILTLKQRSLPGRVHGTRSNLTSDSAARLRAVQEVWLSDAAFEVDRDAAEQAVTLVTDRNQIVPLSFPHTGSIVAFSPSDSFATEITGAVHETGEIAGYDPNIVSFLYTNQTSLTDEQRYAMHDASLVLLATSSTTPEQRSETGNSARFSHDLLTYAQKEAVPVVGLALNQPYDIMYMPDIPVYIATYAGKAGGQNVKAAIRALFGQIPFTGRLPVSLADANGTVMFPLGSGINSQR